MTDDQGHGDPIGTPDPKREGADRDRRPAEPLGGGEGDADFAAEHDETSFADDGGEQESPTGHSGLEPSRRPN
jgi:hypothetical protein